MGKLTFAYPKLEKQPDLERYPPYRTLEEVLDGWNPDDTDNIPSPFKEQLQVFNYSDPYELAVAKKYR